ncbi:endonuclease VII domain-containing protein [Arthrobacter sp. TMN-37]
MDLDGYETLLARQGGGCAICGSSLRADGARLSIDHDHRCCAGEASCGNCIRGILCPNCNRGLGLFQDQPDLLKKAIAYLVLNSIYPPVLVPERTTSTDRS